jgi:hypothetical protein
MPTQFRFFVVPLCTLLALTTVACSNSTVAAKGPGNDQKAVAASSSEELPQPSEADNWQRIKDCAARVDAMQEEKSSKNLQQGRFAHYSRKYGRCFVKLTTTIKLPRLGNRPDEVMLDVMLMDAFEGSVGAMFTTHGSCYLGGKQEDCAKTEAFIDDAMAN